jgi:hypothetical protein
VRQRAISPHAQELRMRAELPRMDAENAVTDCELRDRCADGVDFAGQVAAEDPSLRPAHTGDEAEKNGSPARSAQSVRLTVVA